MSKAWPASHDSFLLGHGRASLTPPRPRTVSSSPGRPRRSRSAARCRGHRVGKLRVRCRAGAHSPKATPPHHRPAYPNPGRHARPIAILSPPATPPSCRRLLTAIWARQVGKKARSRCSARTSSPTLRRPAPASTPSARDESSALLPPVHRSPPALEQAPECDGRSLVLTTTAVEAKPDLQLGPLTPSLHFGRMSGSPDEHRALLLRRRP